MGLNWVDALIVVTYLIAITLFGVHFRKRQQSIHTYFLGGKTVPPWAMALSIVATETSTLTIIGTPGIAFGGNLSFLQLVMGYLVGRVFICLVLIPAYFVPFFIMLHFTALSQARRLARSGKSAATQNT